MTEISPKIRWPQLAIGAVLFAAVGGAAGWAWQSRQQAAATPRAEMERVVHDYLLNHPEILPEAMDRLRQKEQAKQLAGVGDAVETPFPGAVLGNPAGTVTLVEFSDYACTYCRASVVDIDRLLREDRRLKIVFRELPILSQGSEAAARLALVAAQSGRYMAVHRALFASGNPDAAARATIGADLSIDAVAATLNTAAITNELRSNVALARDLGFDGTPSWVVGNRTLTGAVGYDGLRAAIADARSGA